MIEPEIAFAGLKEDMDLAEGGWVNRQPANFAGADTEPVLNDVRHLPYD